MKSLTKLLPLVLLTLLVSCGSNTTLTTEKIEDCISNQVCEQLVVEPQTVAFEELKELETGDKVIIGTEEFTAEIMSWGATSLTKIEGVELYDHEVRGEVEQRVVKTIWITTSDEVIVERNFIILFKDGTVSHENVPLRETLENDEVLEFIL